MHYLTAYRAAYIPRISHEKSTQRVIENALAQLTLWNAVQIQIAQAVGLSVECRIIAGCRRRLESELQGARQISLFLLIGTTDINTLNTNLEKNIRTLERLLPAEYGWSRLSAIDPVMIVPEGERETGWRIARVVRRVEFTSLPIISEGFPLFSSSLLRENRNSSDTKSSKNNLAKQDNQGEKPNSIKTSTEDWTKKRWLPNYQSSDVIDDLNNSKLPLCLPLLGALSQYVYSPKRLFQELEHASPVVVSIAIHPIDPESLRNDRAIATGWKRFLIPFAPTFVNTGISEFKTLQSAFDRYWLPDKYLSNLSIRIAARDDAQALGVAHHMCSRLGGIRGFEVIAPEKDNSISLLGNSTVDIPFPEWTQQQWNNIHNYWRNRLNDEGIKVRYDIHFDLYLDFLARFPHLYTIEETERILTLPIADDEGLANTETKMIPPFSTSLLRYDPVVHSDGNVVSPAHDRVRIGMMRTVPVMSESKGWRDPGVEHWHSIKKNDLTKHAAIFGSTGSGKTLTTLFLIRELQRLKVPFLVIEPVKTEYFDRLKNHVSYLKRFRFEMQGETKEGFFPFDPMRLQEGVSVARHASYLKSCFEAAFPMEPWLALILESGLREYYTDSPINGGCGLTLFTLGGAKVHEYREGQGVFPSLATFEVYFCGRGNAETLQSSFIDRSLNASGNSQLADFAQQNKEMFRRRFRNLTNGILGEACKMADSYFRADPELLYEPFSHYLSGNNNSNNIVLELDGIPDAEQKSLIMAFLMTFLFERRQADDLRARQNGQIPTAELKHVLILEEAHRLLTNTGNGIRGQYVGQDSKAKATSLFVDMLAEIRAFGQGIVIVEQIPTKIVSEAIKNTNLKMMLRLTSKDDRDYLGETMNFTPEQNRFVTSLRALPGEGVQFVVFEEGIDQPLLLNLPLPIANPVSNTWLYDDFFNS